MARPSMTPAVDANGERARRGHSLHRQAATTLAHGANATCATTLIDRTVHHVNVIAFEGESDRRREAKTDKKACPKKAE